MRYAKIRKMDISNGLGVGVSLFTQGCHFHCHNCFNHETWDFNGGKPFTKETEDIIIELIKRPQIERFSILGGEPLEDVNLEAINHLFLRIKKEKPEIKIWIYSGFLYEKLQERIKNGNKDLESILNTADILIDGQFVEELKDITLPFCGSSNQRMIHLSDNR